MSPSLSDLAEPCGEVVLYGGYGSAFVTARANTSSMCGVRVCPCGKWIQRVLWWCIFLCCTHVLKLKLKMKMKQFLQEGTYLIRSEHRLLWM